MGKFLRVLVVLIFLLAAASLTLACMLFVKREILKGRTDILEQGLIKIARTIEAEPPEVPEDPESYPAKDVSDCNAEILDSPTRSEFWDDYKSELESLDQSIIQLETRTRDLMSYYKIDKVTSKPAKHPVTGLKINTGPGTTQGIVDEILEKAKAQYDLLTETRQLLNEVRVELVDTINELNGRKVTLRQKLVYIVDLEGQIQQLNGVVSGLRREIEELNERIRRLENDMSNLQAEKEIVEEENESLTLKVEQQQNIIKELRGQLEANSRTTAGGGGTIAGSILKARVDIAPGIKGSIVRVDQKHQYVVMDLDQTFISELLSVLSDGQLPLVDLLVKRGEEEFVSKVRLSQLKKDDGLAIGDILTDWQQGPIEIGDIIFFQ